MGLFDSREKKPEADFSNVRSGSSSVPDTDAPATRYTVQAGDTLSAIAQREYGDASDWRRIYEANRDQLDNPDLIHPGQELSIPRTEGGAS